MYDDMEIALRFNISKNWNDKLTSVNVLPSNNFSLRNHKAASRVKHCIDFLHWLLLTLNWGQIHQMCSAVSILKQIISSQIPKFGNVQTIYNISVSHFHISIEFITEKVLKWNNSLFRCNGFEQLLLFILNSYVWIARIIMMLSCWFVNISINETYA